MMFPNGLNRQCCLSLSLCVSLLLAPSVARAKTEAVSCEYKYVLGDNDTKHDARKIAFIEAKRRCAEQIGTLLASETVVSSSDLTKDEIRAYSLGLMKTEQVEESFLSSGESLAVVIKLKALYDSEMAAKLKELLSDRNKTQEFKNAQEQIQALEKQIGNLQGQLSKSQPDEQILRLREERNVSLDQYEKIVKNLETLNVKTKRYARCGMTMEEVKAVLGPPRTINRPPISKDKETWNYGEKWLKFQSGVVVAITQDSNPFQHEGRGCKGEQ